MTPGMKTGQYLDAVEAFSGKKFQFRGEIGMLLECATARNMHQVFEDITFLAKFVTNASGVLKRVGPSHADAAKLVGEFKDNLEKVSTLLRTLVKEEPADARQQLLSRFFSLSHDSLDNLLVLLSELSRIKNYTLDQKREA